jgi:hypothetical protein
MRSNISVLVILAFVLMFGLSSCSEDTVGKPLQKTHDVSGKFLPIKVMVFDTESELQRYLQKNRLQKKKVKGLALWNIDAKDPERVYDCTIYVVDPKGLKDKDRFETWGHELVHCVYGSFHEEEH